MSNGKNVDAVAQKLIRYAEIIANNGDQTKMNGKIDSQFSQNGPAEASIFQNMVFDALSNKAINEEEAEYLLKNYAGITTLKDATVTGEKKPGLFKRIMQANGIDFKEKPLKSIGKIIGLIVAMMIGGLTGCTPPNKVIITINLKANVDGLIEELNHRNEADAEWKERMLALLGSMSSKLAAMEATGTEANRLLELIVGLLGNVINNQNLTNEKMDAIIQLITTLMANMDEYHSQLQEAIEKLTTKFTSFSEEVLGKFNELFGKLDGMSDDQDRFFAAALNYIQQIIDNQHLSQEKQDQLYNLGLEILNKLDIQPGPGQQAPDYTELLNAILDKLNNIDANTSTIIDKINHLNEDMLEGIQNIMNNADSNTSEIIAAMDADKAELALILQGLRADVQGLSQTVLDDLTRIIANQGTIIIGQQNITNVLTDNIVPLLTEIKNKIPTSFPNVDLTAVLGRLDAILAKIPDGCNCQQIDLSVIIEKLNTIIEKIGNGNGNDEGVINDLEEELGIS